MSFKFDFNCTSKQAEYEALIIGIEILLEMGASTIHIKGDSDLVIGQIVGDFRIKNWEMCPFHSVAVQLMMEFDNVQVSYMPQECNRRVDHMAKINFGSKPPIDLEGALVNVRERVLPSVQN